MKIILLKDDKDLGKAGSLVDAKDGYARNFLIPRKIAIEATPENLKTWEEDQRRLREEERIRIEEANALKAKLEAMTVNVQAKGGEGGRLFGSITNKEIADAIKAQAKIDIDKKKIELKENIKTTGLKEVVVRVYPEITANLKVQITAK